MESATPQLDAPTLTLEIRKARVQLLASRVAAAAQERIWALVAAPAAGLSICQIAGT